MSHFDFDRLLDFYSRSAFCTDQGMVKLFRDFSQVSNAYSRDNLEAHFTASAFVYDPQKNCSLLIRHKKLGRYLQPGGHADGDQDLLRVALKELAEETAVEDVVTIHGIFDLDRHRIPEHKGVPEHWHYDVRFLFKGDSTVLKPKANHELMGLDWVSPAMLMGIESDESVKRMYQKAQKYWDLM